MPPTPTAGAKPAAALPAAPKPGSYVPPSVRNRGAGGGQAMDDGGRQRRDENSLRVTNLSEDVTEADLQVGGWVDVCMWEEASSIHMMFLHLLLCYCQVHGMCVCANTPPPPTGALAHNLPLPPPPASTPPPPHSLVPLRRSCSVPLAPSAACSWRWTATRASPAALPLSTTTTGGCLGAGGGGGGSLPPVCGMLTLWHKAASPVTLLHHVCTLPW